MTNRIDITLPILALDPGPTHTAYVLFDGREPTYFGKVPNDEMLRSMGSHVHTRCVIEMVACYGMAVGAEVFETCVWIGRFIQARDGIADRLYRQDVKLHLCRSVRANDANIRQAIIDRYGGKEKAIGKKAKPGPLYGVSGDVWAALAVALTYRDRVSVARADVGGGA